MRGALLLLSAPAAAAAQGLSDCDPLVPGYCMLPFPNNFWLRADPSTGRNLTSFGAQTFPPSRAGKHVDAQKGGWNGLDGFSPTGSLNTWWPDLSPDGLPPVWDIARSVQPGSVTVLLDASTGERVAHWAELDHHADTKGGAAPKAGRALMIWPAQRLKDATRYVVAVAGAKHANGSACAPSAAYAALRDGAATQDPDVELRRQRFDDEVFSVLAAAGVARSDTQLAWDFTTASRAALTGALVSMRDDGLKRAEGRGWAFNVTSVDEDYSPLIARRIRGTFDVPLYVDRAGPGARLVRGGDGAPAFQQWSSRPTFTVLLPRMAENATEPLGILQFGHGLFETQTEVQEVYMQNLSAMGHVLIASDWWGMATEDVPAITEMLSTDLTNFGIIPDRLHQGVLNALVLMRVVRSEAFQTQDVMQLGGKRVLTADSARYYDGNSDGGILGTVYMAVTTDVTRGVLGVPGMAYSLMLPRSVDFSPFFTILKLRYPDAVDCANVFSLIQTLWDFCEPSGYAGSLHPDADPLPGTPKHDVVIHFSIGDAQVPNVATLTLARTVGAGVFAAQVPIAPTTPPANWSLYGLRAAASPAAPPLAVGWSYPAPVVPLDNVPAAGKADPHDYTRQQPSAQAMIGGFFADGAVRDTCDGAPLNTCGAGCCGFPVAGPP